jgi:hypothetical protein
MNNIKMYEEFNLDFLKDRTIRKIENGIKIIKETFNIQNLEEVVDQDKTIVSYVYTCNDIKFTGVLRVERDFKKTKDGWGVPNQYSLFIDNKNFTSKVWPDLIEDIYEFLRIRHRRPLNQRPIKPVQTVKKVDPYNEEEWEDTKAKDVTRQLPINPYSINEFNELLRSGAIKRSDEELADFIWHYKNGKIVPFKIVR